MEYILINFMLYVRGNFKNVTIDLAIHSHSAPIFRLRGKYRGKQDIAGTVLIKTIKYYENTKYTLKKGKKKKSAQLSCVKVLHVHIRFFRKYIFNI
jgi:hypothetical protein